MILLLSLIKWALTCHLLIVFRFMCMEIQKKKDTLVWLMNHVREMAKGRWASDFIASQSKHLLSASSNQTKEDWGMDFSSINLQSFLERQAVWVHLLHQAHHLYYSTPISSSNPWRSSVKDSAWTVVATELEEMILVLQAIHWHRERRKGFPIIFTPVSRSITSAKDEEEKLKEAIVLSWLTCSAERRKAKPYKERTGMEHHPRVGISQEEDWGVARDRSEETLGDVTGNNGSSRGVSVSAVARGDGCR